MKNFKRILSVALMLIMTFSILTVGVSAAEFENYYEEPWFLYGDVNFDNRVSVKDATAIQKHLAKIIALCDESLYFADVDGNERNTISDATLIQKYVAKMIDVFPAEIPEMIYSVTADGTALELDVTYDDYITIVVNVESEGYYCMSATTNSETSLYLDLCDENYEDTWVAYYDGETTYAVMKLVPGTYYATMYINEGTDTPVNFKVEPTDYDPPYNFESATELKIGDKIDIKAGITPLIYKVDVSDIAIDDMLYVYTQGENSRTSMECYDKDFILADYSDFYENTDTILGMDNYNDNTTYYVVVNQDEGGSDFTLCCDTTYGLLKNRAKEFTLGTTHECEVVEYIEEDYIGYMSEEVYRFTPETSGYYSFNLFSDTDISVLGVVSDLATDDEGYILLREGEANKRVFDVLYLEENKEYFIILIVSLYEEGKLKFEIRESNEEEYNQAQLENPFEDSTEDEAEPIEISVGDTIELSLDNNLEEMYENIYTLTATENCEIVICSLGSIDATVYVFNENDECIFIGDNILTAVVTNNSIELFESSDFSIKGTLEKGETILLNIRSYADGTDNFTLSVVKASDYEPII